MGHATTVNSTNMNKLPDHSFSDTYAACEWSYWGPANPEIPGQFAVTYKQGYRSSSNPVVSDIMPIARLSQRHPELQTIYNQLGVHIACKGTPGTLVQAEVTVPHPERFAADNRRLLGAASLSGIDFAIYPGELYEPGEFAEELARNRRILLASQAGSPEVAHDIFTHALSWILAPGYFIDQAQEKAQQALQSGEETIASLMTRMDVSLSRARYGLTAPSALAYQIAAQRSGNPAVQPNIRAHWETGVEPLFEALDEYRPSYHATAMGAAAQGHCMQLITVAESLKNAAV